LARGAPQAREAAAAAARAAQKKIAADAAAGMIARACFYLVIFLAQLALHV